MLLVGQEAFLEGEAEEKSVVHVNLQCQCQAEKLCVTSDKDQQLRQARTSCSIAKFCEKPKENLLHWWPPG